ncbi:MAG: ParB/RepB/Spo0J family partition protein [Anaerolineales bacterium]|nr:MAG: ParB/RepB/Spo0J family partition protein [Anaerolineales bacterium]
MSKKRGLGKGLDALIPTGSDQIPSRGGMLQVPVENIQPNPRQPRTSPEMGNISQLADSISEHGILQPLVVLPKDAGGSYTLIAGERRLRAAEKAGLEFVPVIVREANEQQQLEWALVENLQRSDLNPLEIANGYLQLADEFDLSHAEIAKRVGKNRATVSNTLRLLKLSAAVRGALIENKISEGHARALLSLPTAQAQSAALQNILERELSVRQVEELVQRLLGERRKKKPKTKRSPEETDLENQLRDALGTRVTLKRGRRGGSLVIRFFSDEELNALVDRLLASSEEK